MSLRYSLRSIFSRSESSKASFFLSQGLEAGVVGGDAGHLGIDGLQAGLHLRHVRVDAVILLLFAVAQLHGLCRGFFGFLFAGFTGGVVRIPVCVLLHVVGEITGLHQNLTTAGKGEDGIAHPVQK